MNVTWKHHEEGSSNVFTNLGFTPAQAADVIAESTLLFAINDVTRRRKLTQQAATRRCGTDQAMPSTVSRDRMNKMTISRLASGLNALNQDAMILVRAAPRFRWHGRLRVEDA